MYQQVPVGVSASCSTREVAGVQVPRPCPTCKTDIADYMAHAAVNTEMAELINRLKEAAEQARQQADKEAQELNSEGDEDAGDAVEGDAAAEEGGDDDQGRKEEQENGIVEGRQD